MKKIHRLFLWMLLLNKRILKQPLFLILIALVPLLVFGVGRLSQESSSLVTAAVAPGAEEDEVSSWLIDSLVESSSSAVRYIAFSDKDTMTEAVSSGQARIGFLLPKDVGALFEAYGSQKTKNLSEGALALLGVLLGGESASEEMQAHAIVSYAATNDVISKITREQLFGQLYPSLEIAVLKTWLKIHPEVGSMTQAQRDQFVDETLAAYEEAVNLIVEQVKHEGGKLVTSGMGKCGQIADNIATTFSSTGIPAIFLHPSEAQHGDLGVVQPHDVLLLLSNSGRTNEICALVQLAHNLYPQLKIVVITGNKDSELAHLADICLWTGNAPEVCPLGLTPTTSTTMMTVIGDVLVVNTMRATGFTKEDYALRHHGGYLGSIAKGTKY